MVSYWSIFPCASGLHYWHIGLSQCQWGNPENMNKWVTEMHPCSHNKTKENKTGCITYGMKHTTWSHNGMMTLINASIHWSLMALDVVVGLGHYWFSHRLSSCRGQTISWTNWQCSGQDCAGSRIKLKSRPKSPTKIYVWPESGWIEPLASHTTEPTNPFWHR